MCTFNISRHCYVSWDHDQDPDAFAVLADKSSEAHHRASAFVIPYTYDQRGRIHAVFHRKADGVLHLLGGKSDPEEIEVCGDRAIWNPFDTLIRELDEEIGVVGRSVLTSGCYADDRWMQISRIHEGRRTLELVLLRAVNRREAVWLGNKAVDVGRVCPASTTALYPIEPGMLRAARESLDASTSPQQSLLQPPFTGIAASALLSFNDARLSYEEVCSNA